MPRIYYSIVFFFGFTLNLHAQQPPAGSLLASREGVSGVALMASNGKPLFENATGFSSYVTQTPMLNTDIFELASVSKQFTAMIIMMLEEKGKLAYDDPVDKYLAIPYKGITIRHLLTHTSGLPDYQAIMGIHWDKSKVAGNPECIEYLNRYAPPALFAPGERYQYSNTGYLLLASIAEMASGKDFTGLCRKWIFRKLKMRDTDLRTPAEKTSLPNLAYGHIYDSVRGRYVRADSFPASDYTIWLGRREGPGRISSTVQDLLKWDQALYTNKLVKQSTLAQAYVPATLHDGGRSNYGFGWILRTDSTLGRVVYHTGDNPGYKTIIVRYIDQNKTIILLCNNASRVFDALLKQMEVTLKWLKTQDDEQVLKQK